MRLLELALEDIHVNAKTAAEIVRSMRRHADVREVAAKCVRGEGGKERAQRGRGAAAPLTGGVRAAG